MDRKQIFRIVILGISIIICLTSIAWGLTPQQVAQKAFPSVVLLVMEDANGQPLSMGSGFFVRKNVIATNMHVIEGATGGYAKIVKQKTKYNIGGTVGIKEETDLALLLADGAKGAPLALGNGGKVQVGDEIYAIGNPLGLEGTFSRGIVSGVHNLESETIFQITAPISPGSSGGPILNSQGEVIGVSVATIKEGQSLNFAIPVYYLTSLLSNITPVKRLSVPKQRKGPLGSFGTTSLEGVKVRKPSLEKNIRGRYYLYYSLYNQLSEPINNIHLLIIFYDKEGYPLDAIESEYTGKSIRPNLSARTAVGMYRLIKIMTEEWGEGFEKIEKAVEFRILGYLKELESDGEWASIEEVGEVFEKRR